jgi:RES domain-containing protein
VSEIAASKLPDDWTRYPATYVTKLLGDKWAKDKQSVVLKVPSVIIPEEFNYLINPLHPDFKKLSLGPPAVYYLDPRVKKT